MYEIELKSPDVAPYVTFIRSKLIVQKGVSMLKVNKQFRLSGLYLAIVSRPVYVTCLLNVIVKVNVKL